MLNELKQHAASINIRIDLDNISEQFQTLDRLRQSLIDRLRFRFLTVWAGLHNLLKQAYNRFKTFEFYQAQQAKTADKQPPPPPSTKSPAQAARSSSMKPARHERARAEADYLEELAHFYRTGKNEFERWLEGETYTLALMCTQTMNESSMVMRQHQANVTPGQRPKTYLRPSHRLKLTIKRAEVGAPLMFCCCCCCFVSFPNRSPEVATAS